MIIRGSVVGPYRIPSESMYPTLQKGDHILVNKLSYGIRLPFVEHTVFQYSEPQRYDIVVFTRPDEPASKDIESDMNYIKRVIGLPGETIEVTGRKVFINGQPLMDDNKAVWQEGGLVSLAPTVIPPGHVVLMGDNRDHSKDSRLWATGPFLDITRIRGRAFFIYWNSGWDTSRFFRILR